jgi:hypothetical protein
MLAANLRAVFGVTPYLVGPAKMVHAEDLKRRFRAQVPGTIVRETLLGPRELTGVFAKSAINVPTCRYDALGTNIVETAL